MIEIKGLCKTFNPGTINEVNVFDNLNLSLNEGDFITVIGGNGAGKSTLLNIISGSIEADSGMILLNNVDVSRLKEHQRAPYFGHVFQDPMKGTAPDMTVLENLALAYARGRTRSIFRWSIRVKDKQYYIDQLKSLELGLEDKMYQKVGLLSGGQRQALTLLMATMGQKPSHKKIIKDYVKFFMGDKEAAKEEISKVYKEAKEEYINKIKEIKLVVNDKNEKEIWKAKLKEENDKFQGDIKEIKASIKDKEAKKEYSTRLKSAKKEHLNNAISIKSMSVDKKEKKLKLKEAKVAYQNAVIDIKHASKVKKEKLSEIKTDHRNRVKEIRLASKHKGELKEAYDEFDKKIRAYDLTKPVLLLDEHTAALDPKTAAKVLKITDRIVKENNLTTIMITHNMKDAITHGNRLIMMSKGKIIFDVSGEEKSKLTIEQLLEKFNSASGDSLSDAAILGD